jgi:protein involved in polysaccharide export with SLBB domain
MNKIFLVLGVCASLFAQTTDVNAMRMAQSKISSLSYSNPTISNENQRKMIIKVDQPINPDKYLVGPGDQFLVNIISSENVSNYTLTVSPTGEILIPSVGNVQVNGQTLTSSIKNMINAIESLTHNAKIYIVLSEIREFKVKVIGHLQNPGYYIVTPVTRVSDLYEGILRKLQSWSPGDQDADKKADQIPVQESEKIIYPELSRRNIEISRNGETILVDLVKFGSTGSDNNNPFIEQGDVVKMLLREHFVGIFGGIKIPGNYEFKEGETLSQFVNLAGGLRPDADPNKVEISRFISSKDKFTFYTTMSQADTILISSEDHIMIRYDQEYKRQNIVYVTGEIKYPGVYAIEPGKTTIGEALEKGGGFTSRADQSKIIINNKSIANIPDREYIRILLIPDGNRSPEEKAYIKARMLTQKGTIESSSLEQAESLMEHPLVNQDQIVILANFNYIEILGGVLKPGRYPYVTDITFDKYISLAGGITNTATRKKFIIKAGTGQRLPIKKNAQIENGDTIFIPEKMEYNKYVIIKDVLSSMGQVAALIVVIQNTIGI